MCVWERGHIIILRGTVTLTHGDRVFCRFLRDHLFRVWWTPRLTNKTETSLYIRQYGAYRYVYFLFVCVCVVVIAVGYKVVIIVCGTCLHAKPQNAHWCLSLSLLISILLSLDETRDEAKKTWSDNLKKEWWEGEELVRTNEEGYRKRG